ncbi:MAG TPA: tetratricopeptide repeat protein [Anaerolineales bacterium]|nr:tetratricopeptide repeat protein [Anaerolineales bacterium]
MNEISSFGNWIRRRRKALDLTQTDLAGMVFCSLSMIKKIELDERRPSRVMAERLAECLEITGPGRTTFLAVASETVALDRFKPAIGSFASEQPVSNIRSHQPLTPFVGYGRELAEISSLIIENKSRMVTLVGLGGIGKTRLAIQTAIELTDHYSGGVYFISLVQLDHPKRIISAILGTLSQSRFALSDPKSYLLEYLHDKEMLLILDNFEHLLEGAALLADVINACPSLVMLITSRVPLNLSVEQVYEVRGLQVDALEGDEKPETIEAVQLFIQISRRAGNEEKLTSDTIATIVRICKLVEGMPLALEIAGSWARTRSFAQIEAGIKSDLEFLTSKMHDIPERHRSIQATFEFSWKILSEEEKRVFSILSIFRGGFNARAAETIAATDHSIIDSLVSKSLLMLGDADRYDFHELLRRFSELKLNDGEKPRHYRDLHLSYFLNLAERSLSEKKLEQPADPSRSIEKDMDNFRAALQTALEYPDQDRGLRLAVALETVWYRIGSLQEGMTWLNRMLELEKGQFPAFRAKALLHSSRIAQELGDFEQALILGKASLFIYKELRDNAGIGQALLIMGIVRYLNGEFEGGIKLLERSLSIFQQIGDEESQAQALIRVADLNMRRGMLDLARGQMEEALMISSRLDNQYWKAFSMGGLGEINRLQGKYLEAFELYKESIKIHWQEHHRLDLPYLIEAIALDFASLGKFGQSVFLWGAAETLRDKNLTPLPPSYRLSYAPVIEQTRKQLGEAEFLNFWQAGRNEPIEDVLYSSIGWPEK